MTVTETAAPVSGVDYDRFFIGGDWIAPSTDSMIDVISPATEERIGRVPEAREGDIDAAVTAARKAFDDRDGWGHWRPEKRREALLRFGKELEQRGAEMMRRVSSQNGMPIWLAEQLEAGSRRCCSTTTPAS